MRAAILLIFAIFLPQADALKLNRQHSSEPVLSDGVVNIGDCARFRTFKSKLLPGRTIKLTGLGGSASAGAGLDNLDEHYLNQVAALLKERFGVNVKTRTTAIGATGSDYWAHCAGAHLSQDVDATFGDFAINDVKNGGSTNRYAPHEGRVLEAVLSNVANVGHVDSLFVSANFASPSTGSPGAGLDQHGFMDMYEKHGVPVVDVAHVHPVSELGNLGMYSKNPHGHPSAKQHRLLAELFLEWIERSDQSCPLHSQKKTSLGAVPIDAVEKQDKPQEWAAGRSPTHPAMEGPMHCKTTLGPRAEGAFLYPLGAAEGVAMEADPSVEGIETGVPPGVHAVPGWELKSPWHALETAGHVRQDLKLRWMPNKVGVPLRLPADVGSLGAIGLVYFDDKEYGDFDVTLFQDGKETTRPVVQLSGYSNGRHTRTDVLWTGLKAGKYEVHVEVKKLPGIGVVGLSSA